MMKSIDVKFKMIKAKKNGEIGEILRKPHKKRKNKKSRLRAFARTQVKNYSIDLALIIKWEKTEFWSYEIAEITIK